MIVAASAKRPGFATSQPLGHMFAGISSEAPRAKAPKHPSLLREIT